MVNKKKKNKALNAPKRKFFFFPLELLGKIKYYFNNKNYLIVDLILWQK